MLLLVVVLFFGVACSASPTSEDGKHCLVGCYIAAVFPAESDFCERVSSFMTCWKPCPSSRYDAVVHQLTRLYQEQCSRNASEQQPEKFWHSYEDLFKRLTDRASRCEDRAPEDDEARCRNLASCLLGSALDELKADYPENVVTAVADVRKLVLAYYLKDPQSPPAACSFLYEPYKA